MSCNSILIVVYTPEIINTHRCKITIFASLEIDVFIVKHWTFGSKLVYVSIIKLWIRNVRIFCFSRKYLSTWHFSDHCLTIVKAEIYEQTWLHCYIGVHKNIVISDAMVLQVPCDITVHVSKHTHTSAYNVRLYLYM